MPSVIRDGDTVYVIDSTQIRWFEYDDRRQDLTIFYHNGQMDTIRHRNIKNIFNDLLLTFNVLDLDSRDYQRVR
jgi:hypothetical protein